MKYCQLTLQSTRYQIQKSDIQWMQINVFCANIKMSDTTYEGTRVFCRILFLDDLRFESSVNSQGKQTILIMIYLHYSFESSVNSQGKQTASILSYEILLFESSVNSQGKQTGGIYEDTDLKFESSVNSQGKQTLSFTMPYRSAFERIGAKISLMSVRGGARIGHRKSKSLFRDLPGGMSQS